MSLKVYQDTVPGDFLCLRTVETHTRIEAGMEIIDEVMTQGMGTQFGSLGDCLVETFDLVETSPGVGVGLRLKNERVLCVRLTKIYPGVYEAENSGVSEGKFSVEFWVPKP